MKERDFRIRLVSLGSDIRVMDEAVALAKEAGATFEPEMYRLPELGRYEPAGCDLWSIKKLGGAFLSADQAVEVIRRCKAVEEAVAETERAIDSFSSTSPGEARTEDLYGTILRLRRILEGTK